MNVDDLEGRCSRKIFRSDPLPIAVRAGTEPVPLPWGGEIATSHGAIVFMLVAVTTFILLARAGWQRSPAAT